MKNYFKSKMMAIIMCFVIFGITTFNASAISTVTIGSNSIIDNNWPSAWQPNAISTAIYTTAELNTAGIPNSGTTIISKLGLNVLNINNLQTNSFDNVYILLRNTTAVNASQLIDACGMVGLDNLVAQGFKIVKGPFALRGADLELGWNDFDFEQTFTYTAGYNLQLAIVSVDLRSTGNVNDFRVATYPAGNSAAFYSPFTHCRPATSFPNQTQNLKPMIRMEIEGNYTGQVYRSFVCEQAVVTVAQEGNQNVNILKVEIKIFGDVAPLNNLTQMVFNGKNSSPIATNAKLYYTGQSPVFEANSTNLVGSASVTNNITFNGDVQLKHGSNYFWLAYDIANTIADTGRVDASLTSFVLSRTGSVSASVLGDPAGAIFVKKSATIPLPPPTTEIPGYGVEFDYGAEYYVGRPDLINSIVNGYIACGGGTYVYGFSENVYRPSEISPTGVPILIQNIA